MRLLFLTLPLNLKSYLLKYETLIAKFFEMKMPAGLSLSEAYKHLNKIL